MDEESTAVNEQVVADTTTTDSAPVENVSSEVAEDEFDGLGDIDLNNPSAVKEETESKPEAESLDEAKDTTDETTTDTQPLGKAEERKQQLNEEIRDLVARRNSIRAEVERSSAEVYQPATDEELLGQINPETGEYYNHLEAKLAAMEQRQEIDRYNSQVSEAQLTLSSEASKALSDFPMFDEESKQYDPEIASKVDQILGANLIFDRNTNQVIGSNISPYQLYQTVAATYQAAASKGQAEAQKATQRMMANADIPSGSADKGSGDSLDDAFSRIKDFKFSA